MSLLALAAVLKEEYVIVDGTLNDNACDTILNHINHSKPPYFLGVTVMGGPSLRRAYEHCKRIKEQVPDLTIIWGGYFPTIFPDCVANTDIVDFVIRGQGEFTLLELLGACKNGAEFSSIDGLSYKENGKIIHNQPRKLVSPDSLPQYPYEVIDVNEYIVPTFIGRRTVCYHSSIGCPYKCNFCGVVKMYPIKWLAESAERVVSTLCFLKEQYNIDGVEIADNNFFVSESRTAAICDGIKHLNLSWYAEGRIDTLLKYSDETWVKMKESGCRLIYLGAESGSDIILQKMEKDLTVDQTVALNKKARRFDIIPYFFFVVGNPYDPEMDINESINLVYHLKKDNPDCEILFTPYTPIPIPGMYDEATSKGFKYPSNLEEWFSGDWESFEIRKNPLTPWLKPSHINTIRNFGVVLDARFPTVTEIHANPKMLRLLKVLSSWRYRSRFFSFPLELKLLSTLYRYQRQDNPITAYDLPIENNPQ